MFGIQSMRRGGIDGEVNRWVVLFVATFSQLTISYIAQGIGTLAPFIAQTFQLNNTLIGLSGVAINAGIMLTSALAGTLVDIIGEKLVLVAGGFLAGAAIMLTSTASTFSMFLSLLFFTGLWVSVASPAGSKAVMIRFPISKRGLALGIRQTGIPLGGLAAALSLPIMALHVNWRGAMICMGVVSMVGAIVALFVLKKSPDQTITRSAQNRGKGMLRQVAKKRSVILLSVMGMTYVSAQYTIVAHLVVFVHVALGHTIILASLLLALTQLTGAMARIVLGLLSDTLFHGRRKPLLILCGALGVVIAGLLSRVTSATPTLLIAVLLLLFGFAGIGWNGLFVTFLSEEVGVDLAGSAVGLGLTLIQVGVLGFPPLFGYIVDSTGAYSSGWILLSGVMLLGLLVLTLVKENHDEVSTVRK